jgi:hypothetical protein
MTLGFQHLILAEDEQHIISIRGILRAPGEESGAKLVWPPDPRGGEPGRNPRALRPCEA